MTTAAALPDAVFARLLWHEGVREPHDTGYSNNPIDPGGATNWGVTQASYDAWRRSRHQECVPVRQLSRAEAQQITEARYWRDGKAALVAGAGAMILAEMHFDWGFNGGIARASWYLQLALHVPGVAPVDADGAIGPRTLGVCASIAGRDFERAAAVRYLHLRALHHRGRAGEGSSIRALGAVGLPDRFLPARNTTQRVFLKGWLARCRGLAKAHQITPTPAYAPGAEDVLMVGP